jgi:hypothetical protein
MNYQLSRATGLQQNGMNFSVQWHEKRNIRETIAYHFPCLWMERSIPYCVGQVPQPDPVVQYVTKE